MAEPRYEYVLRTPYGLKALVERYAAGRKCSFNRAVIELLETHPLITAIYSDIISGSSQQK